ncbi:26S protease regulatory subunit S10B [Apiospora arundinis]
MAQRIFIDNLAGYRALPPCAERPVHVIVKDMASGCGDGQRTTSYGCFCSTSSTQFVSIISKEVAKRCLPDTATAVAQATDLFGSYCAIGSAANGTAVVMSSKTVSASGTTAATATLSGSSASPTTSVGVAPSRPTLPASPSQTDSAGAKSQSYSRTLVSVLLGFGVAGAL